MKKINNQYKSYKCKNLTMTITYDRPANRRGSAEPVRGRINIHSAGGKRLLTKGEVYGDKRNTKLDYVVYGKSKREIYNEKIPEASAKLYAQLISVGHIQQDTTTGFIGDPVDLAEFLIQQKEDFFAINYQNVRSATRRAYKAQYDLAVADCCGFRLDSLTSEDYSALIERICSSAAQQSRSENKGWSMGQEAPASAKKRLAILFTALRYFIKCGYRIPEPPEGYVGQPSREEEIMDLVDHVRSFPLSASKIWAGLFKDSLPILSQLFFLQLDTAIRIGELLALTWGNILKIACAQGFMYAIQITGQINSQVLRTETLKTPAAYRTIPISTPLGQSLIKIKERLSKEFQNIDNTMILAVPSEDGTALIVTPEIIAKQRRDYLDVCDSWFQEADLLAALKANRAYKFNTSRQDSHLENMLTDHALRRNRITELYTTGGISTAEISREAGHTENNQRTIGLTEEEIRLLCLKKMAAGTKIFPATRLKCSASDTSPIPACHFSVSVPPRSESVLRVYSTEPDTNLRITAGPAAVNIKDKTVTSSAILCPPREELLADSSFFDIKQVRPWIDVCSNH